MMVQQTADNQPHGALLMQGGTQNKSLEQVNGTIAVPKSGSFWRRLLAFSGPGALIAVGLYGPWQLGDIRSGWGILPLSLDVDRDAVSCYWYAVTVFGW
ncbi:Mn2+ or Fe2+ transporter [Fructobacillus cardui]|nr:Mn2+ or Fe2+ transporter [Fructobacillus cardui]